MIARLNVQMTNIVRPFILERDEEGRLQLPVRLRPLTEEDVEAVIRWGRPSPSSYVTHTIEGQTGFDVKDRERPEDEPEEPEEEEVPGEIQLRETSRSVKIVRVENPEDPDNWVDVEDVVNITFRTPDGKLYKFHFKS